MGISKVGWFPESFPKALSTPIDNYYTGIVANVLMFFIGYGLSLLLPEKGKEMKNLTVWTQEKTPLD